MRILIVSQLYPPEMGALSSRMYPITRELTACGHDVYVATGMPNYPEGVVFPDYRGVGRMAEKQDGVTVLRTAYHTAPRNRSKASQLRSYLSFVAAAFRSGLRAGKVDMVLVTSPPLFPAAAAVWLARRSGAPLVLDLRDLWPDELITYGGLPETSPFVRLVGRLERWAYRCADCVCGTTQPILDTVVQRGVAPEKTFLLPNGADLELFRPLPRENSIAAEYPFGNRFVVMYSGLFGIKHGLEVLLEAAELLRNERNLAFFLLGNGARRDSLAQHVRDRGLDSVVFGGERPIHEIPSLVSRADLCFAAVRPEPYPKKVISVKVFEYLACERPVVGALSGESARVLQESGGGIVVEPGDATATAEAILALSRNPERREAMGKAGRRYVEENYSRSAWAARLEQKMTALHAARRALRTPAAPLVSPVATGSSREGGQR